MELEIQTEKVKRLAENLDAIERKLNKNWIRSRGNRK